MRDGAGTRLPDALQVAIKISIYVSRASLCWSVTLPEGAVKEDPAQEITFNNTSWHGCAMSLLYGVAGE